jgi:hypothetical protein
MSRVRTVAWGVLAWTALSTTVQAGSMDTSGSWVYFFLGSPDRPAYTPSSPNLFGTSPQSAPTVAPPPQPVYTPPAPAPPPIAAPDAAQPVITPTPVLTTQPVFATSSTPAPTPPAASAAASAGSSAPDAFLNFTSSNFLEASQLTTGTPQAWYLSPSVAKVFGGTAPTSAQQSAFASQVFQDVQQTFSLVGIHPTLTLDPSAHAAHTLSVVSGASYSQNANAIGITDVGQNGFGFIDKLSYANTPDQLAWSVAHNISHELMHAFGVAVHHDQTGNYLDAATANWSLLTDPNTTFSAAAAQDIASHLAQAHSTSTQPVQLGSQLLNAIGDPLDGYQLIAPPSPSPVPEPSTWAAWSLGLVAIGWYRQRMSKGRAA